MVRVPAIGHGALASWGGWEQCPRSVAAAFLRDPTAPLDTSCVDAMPHVTFEPRFPSVSGSRSDDIRALLRDARQRCESDARCHEYLRFRSLAAARTPR